MPELECDPLVPSNQSPIPHDYEVVDQEYGSLDAGGSYGILLCKRCKRIVYSQLPD